MLSQPAVASLSDSSRHAPHLSLDACPWCEQQIPPEQLALIGGKIAAKQRLHDESITSRLQAKHLSELAQNDARAAAAVTSARDEARKVAEAEGVAKLAEADRARRELEARAKEEVAQANAARVKAEQTQSQLREQLEKQRQQNEAEIARARTEATEAAQAGARTQVADLTNKLALQSNQHETELKAQRDALEKARQEEFNAAAAKLAEADRARRELEARAKEEVAQANAARVTAEQTQSQLLEQLEKQRQQNEAEIARARTEATEAAQAGARTQVADLTNKLALQSNKHETELKAQRDALEKARQDEVNAAASKSFGETQKLLTQISDLKRQLEKKTADELGEGAEIDLFNTLRQAFPRDDIQRVGKGQPGADIEFIVLHNGQEYGKIILDSKNHKKFATEQVTQLANNKVAARADHAILSLLKFPRGTSQLHAHQDGVLLANPARVLELVKLLRAQIIQNHSLRLSEEKREGKTAELYAFITSERYSQLLSSVEIETNRLFELQTDEQRWHAKHWEKENDRMCAIQKARADFTREVARIIGTGPDSDTQS